LICIDTIIKNQDISSRFFGINLAGRGDFSDVEKILVLSVVMMYNHLQVQGAFSGIGVTRSPQENWHVWRTFAYGSYQSFVTNPISMVEI
jgi:hypothetical protein